tara:strand:- start:134 stop:922 length:789 start_codon:yes stop_codon:yes gene_type:complete
MANLIVGDITPRSQYNATANQLTFSYLFPIFVESDLKVYIGSTLKALITDYTVTGEGSSSGGTVVFNAIDTSVTPNVVYGPSAGDVVTIYRDLPVARSSDYQTGGTFRAETLNDDLDTVIMIAQQLEDQVNNNTLTVDQFDDTSVNLTLPVKDTRKGTVLGFNATTGAPEAGPTIANVNSLAGITTSINTLAGIAANVTTVAGNTTNINTIANNMTTLLATVTQLDTLAVSRDEDEILTVDASGNMVWESAPDQLTLNGGYY